MESANPNADTPKPCSGGCGFFGSASLNYHCSVCFKKGFGEEEFKRRTEAPAVEKPATGDPPAPSVLPLPTRATVFSRPHGRFSCRCNPLYTIYLCATFLSLSSSHLMTALFACSRPPRRDPQR